MEKYLIPVEWSLSKILTIKADSLEDALKEAKYFDLPETGSYIDGSFEVRLDLMPDSKEKS